MTQQRETPTLLFVIGPPAVGKMTVGQAIAERTDFKLFHNHASIEAVLPLFHFGHPSFVRLVEGFRNSVFREVAGSDLPGLVFTYVWAFGEPGEAEGVERYAAPFRERGGRVLFLELEADIDTRLERNRAESRLAAKASKRDVTASQERLLEDEQKYTLNSGGDFDERTDWLRIDNSRLAPEVVASMAIEHFGLPEVGNL